MESELRDFNGTLSEQQIDEIAQEIFKISDQNSLSWDMVAQQNDAGRYEISLTDEDGNGEDYWSFDTEAIADKVLDRLGDLVEKNNN